MQMLFARHFLVGVLGILFLLSPQQGMSYIQRDSFLSLDTGWRWDKIENRFIGTGGTLFGRSQGINRINSYQLGASGAWVFCSDFYVKATGHYGWILSGRYDEAKQPASIDGHTWDVSGGIGYFFCMHPCWWFTPSIGWSYDVLDITGKNVNGQTGIFVGNVKAKSSFQSPWIGFGYLFKPNRCFDLFLNYELHKARWHGQRVSSIPNIAISETYADKRWHNHVWANVFEVDATYYFCSCWNLGIDVKYQIWKGHGHGGWKRTFGENFVPPIIEHRYINELEWDSFSTMVHLGLQF